MLSSSVVVICSSASNLGNNSLYWNGQEHCIVLYSNGVRQGSILSPLLFALYLDGLLSELVECGVGCHWGNLFAGCLCYADDIVLLAPCPSALRMMLQ